MADGLILPEELRQAVAANAATMTPIRFEWKEVKVHPSWREDQLGKGPWISTALANRTVLGNEKCYERRIFTEIDNVPCNDGPDGESAFDGQFVYCGGNRKRNLSKFRAKNSLGRYFNFDYFSDAGFTLCDRAPVSFKSTLTEAIRSGSKVSAIEKLELKGRPCVCVHTARENSDRKRAELEDTREVAGSLRGLGAAPDYIRWVVESIHCRRAMPAEIVQLFYLDVEYNYALTQWEERIGDGEFLLEQISNEQFEQVGSRSIWLPRHCTWKRYLPTDAMTQPRWRHEIWINTIQPGVGDSQFVLNYTAPGTFIEDRSQGDAMWEWKQYKINSRRVAVQTKRGRCC